MNQECGLVKDLKSIQQKHWINGYLQIIEHEPWMCILQETYPIICLSATTLTILISMIANSIPVVKSILSRSNDDVVDWDEDELHEEANESHHHKSNRRTNSNFGEFWETKSNQQILRNPNLQI